MPTNTVTLCCLPSQSVIAQGFSCDNEKPISIRELARLFRKLYRRVNIAEALRPLSWRHQEERQQSPEASIANLLYSSLYIGASLQRCDQCSDNYLENNVSAHSVYWYVESEHVVPDENLNHQETCCCPCPSPAKAPCPHAFLEIHDSPWTFEKLDWPYTNNTRRGFIYWVTCKLD